jgi:hypothetical protein
MTTWTAVVARDLVVNSGAGATFLHGIAPGEIDGFAVGALMTGAAFVAISAPKLLRKTRLSARPGLLFGGMRHARVEPDYFAAPAGVGYFGAPTDAERVADTSGVPEEAEDESYVKAGGDPYAAGTQLPAESPYAAGDSEFAAKTATGPFGVGTDDDIVLPGADDADVEVQPEPVRGGYRSRHRMTGQDGPDHKEARRNAPKHAAPSGGFGAWVGSRFAMLPLPARG